MSGAPTFDTEKKQKRGDGVIINDIMVKQYAVSMPVNSINTGTITPGENRMVGEAKMAKTTINVLKVLVQVKVLVSQAICFFLKDCIEN